MSHQRKPRLSSRSMVRSGRIGPDRPGLVERVRRRIFTWRPATLDQPNNDELNTVQFDTYWDRIEREQRARRTEH